MARNSILRPTRFIRRLSLIAILFASSWLYTNLALAEENNTISTWGLCPSSFGPPPLLGFVPNITGIDNATHIRADKASSDPQRNFVIEGNVMLQRGKLLLHADSVHYDHASDSIIARGHVNYQYAGVRMDSDQATISLGQQVGKIAASKYWMPQRHLRGKADAIVVDKKARLSLQNASVTSCNDGNSDWYLRTSELTLDQANNEGEAWNARLDFLHVPIFYFPYISFPLSGRKTGFLIPDAGTSTLSGNSLALPFYWNISPNRDATITPTFYSKRGNELETEFRYLNHDSSGQINLAYLPNDKVYGNDRKNVQIRHTARPAPGWSYGLSGQYVSDDQYFNDFGDQLSVASQTELERRLDVHYQAEDWRFDGLLQGFQTLDPTIVALDQPYQRRPQLVLTSNTLPTVGGINLDFRGELVRFYRKQGVTGTRVDLQPRISADYRRAEGYFSPSLIMRHTRYVLEHNASGTDDTPSRSLPQFNLDSGMYFERNFDLLDRALVQTLEPRFYYLYVPYRDQSNLVVDETGTSRTFDSALPQFSFDQLFRNNRFTGADRVGDANQVTLALTSRLLTTQGRELLSASMGEILYFRSREVTLPGDSVDNLRQSDQVAELRSHWNEHIQSAAALQWDAQTHQNARGSFSFRYQQDQDRIAQFSYRYERGSMNQTDTVLLWPIARHWKVVGRWYYSWLNTVPLERMFGIEYESCCWTARIVSRNYISSLNNTQHNSTILLQLELKGLASVGEKVKDLFDTGNLN